MVTWVLGRFVYMDCFGRFSSGVFLSSGFSPLVSSLSQQVLFTDPFGLLLELAFLSHGAFGLAGAFFWLCFYVFGFGYIEEFCPV